MKLNKIMSFVSSTP